MRFRLVDKIWLGLWCSAVVISAEAADVRPGEAVTFRRQAPAKGDVARQSVVTSTSMDVSVHLGQQVVHENATLVERAQERSIRLTHVEPDVRMASEVTYHKAGQAMTAGSDEAESLQQPVQGKTYRVEREGEELRILDEHGLVPPQDEYEIVWHSMESFGKANPLAEFLNGRTVSVGQTLDLPQEAAVHLLAFGDDVVTVERFALTLQEVRTAEGQRRAVFRAFISSRTHGQRQMGMQVEGILAVDADTSRVVSLEIAGPIGMTETHVNGPDTYLVSGRGKIQVAMHGSYGRAK